MKKMSIFAVLFLALVISGCTPGQDTYNGGGVDLGSAADFVILGKSGITTTGTTAVTGNLGLSPAAASFYTGFGLIIDASSEWSASSLVTGKIYASDYAAPTPSKMTTAISDMETAYTDAAGRILPDFTELYAGDISGQTLVPGIYKWGTSVLMSTDVTISGGPFDVWVFQIAQGLTLASAARVILAGGAQAKNIFWQVAGDVTLGTTSHLEGTVLSHTAINLGNGASVNGRLFSQTAVALDANAVTQY